MGFSFIGAVVFGNEFAYVNCLWYSSVHLSVSQFSLFLQNGFILVLCLNCCGSTSSLFMPVVNSISLHLCWWLCKMKVPAFVIFLLDVSCIGCLMLKGLWLRLVNWMLWPNKCVLVLLIKFYNDSLEFLSFCWWWFMASIVLPFCFCSISIDISTCWVKIRPCVGSSLFLQIDLLEDTYLLSCGHYGGLF